MDGISEIDFRDKMSVKVSDNFNDVDEIILFLLQILLTLKFVPVETDHGLEC